MVDICYVRPPTLVFQCAGCRSILSDSDLFVCSIETLNLLVVTGVQANVVQSQDEEPYGRGYLDRQLQVEVGSMLTQSTSLAASFRKPNATGKPLVGMLQPHS